jgi:glycerol-3-phosphate dehydrogenase
MPERHKRAVSAAGRVGRVPAPDRLTALASTALDLLVVGGGISGVCIAMEAAQRGLAVGLVERSDYGAGATANCLKIVHGGLRYLQHLDFRRVRASAAERSVWLRSAPHLVEPLPVLMPTFRGRFPPRPALAAALLANEVFSTGRNRGVMPGREIPRARVLSRRECIGIEPSVEAPGLTGGVLFHDALMYSPERLTFEVLEAARRAGALAANHVEFTAPILTAGKVAGARVRDTLTGQMAEVRTRWIVNATGAAVPSLAARLAQPSVVARQRYSVALSFVTRQPAPPVAFTATAGRPGGRAGAETGGRQLFVVPWRGQTMVGTAHLEHRGDPAKFVLEPEHVERFMEEVRSARPALGLQPDDVVLVHGGLLPVARPSQGGKIHLLRHHWIVDHSAEGCAGAISVVTVKFTTARQVAAAVVDRIARSTARLRTSGPDRMPLPGGAFLSLDQLRSDAAAQYGDLLPADTLEHLLRTYGARYEAVLDHRHDLPDWDQRVVPDAPVIRAQLLHATLAEDGRTADDLLWRRTELGPRGLVTPAARQAAEDIMTACRVA